MPYSNFIKLVIISLSLLNIYSCGGGDGNNSQLSSNDFPPSIVYQGLTTEGEVSLESSSGIVRALFTFLDANTPGSSLNPALRVVRKYPPSPAAIPYRPANKDQVFLGERTILENCDNAGEGYIESAEDSPLVFYSNCLLDGVLFDGEIEIYEISSTQNYAKALTNIKELNIKHILTRDNSFEVLSDIDMSGVIEVELTANFDIIDETYTYNIVLRDNLENTYIKLEDLVHNVFQDSYLDSIHGSIFLSDHGHFEITTLSSINYFTSVYKVSGSGSSVNIIYSDGSYSMVEPSYVILEIDSNLDNEIDHTVRFSTALIFTPAFTDLVDSDSDGMFNSFENYYGSNPNDATDQEIDTDGDGMSNFQELLFFSDAGDPESYPESSDLSIIEANTDFERLPTDYIFYLAFKATPISSKGIIEITLPDNIEFINFESTTQYDCTYQNNIILCDREFTLDPTGIVKLKSVQTGQSQINFKIVNLVADPNLQNNSRSLDLEIVTNDGEVLDSLTSIENSTTSLPPGNYLYGLSSIRQGSKLVSTDGPELTYLYPKRHLDFGTVISPYIVMDNNSELNGFTVFVDFAGDSIFGSLYAADNTIISNNIFLRSQMLNANYFGSQQPSSSIFNFSRSLNLTFENNMVEGICDSNPTSSTFPPIFGLSAFQGNADIVMQNNIFANNKCTLFEASSISDYSLRLTNNTFYNNYRIIDGILGYNGSIYKINATNNIFSSNESITNPWFNDILVNEDNLNIDLQNSIFSNNLFFDNIYVDPNNPDNIANFDNAYSGFNDNIQGDPTFVDPENLNFLLSSTSPAIDSGTSDSAPTYDFYFQSRPYDGNFDTIPEVDIGAHEFH